MDFESLSEIVLDNSTSPFDQIQHIDADGSEYWVARELMPILGYQQWRQFEDAISRAIAACENIGQESEKHFLRVAAKSTGGRPREDFRLSRYGSYLTAMNGDSRKPEIAAAQNYFAVKTREAELAPGLITQLLLRFEQQNQVIEEQGRVIAQIQSQILTLLPPSTDFIPPGWDNETWQSLPPQDKRHFRYLWRRRNFQPSPEDSKEAEVISTEEIKQQQQAELKRVAGEIPSKEMWRIEDAKQEMLARFWAQEGGKDEK
jgi:DNA-damage-inducible protein D